MKENTNALALIQPEADELSVKKALYNLESGAENALGDCINKTLSIVAAVFTECDVTDRETGELKRRARVLAIDSDGQTYHTTSAGLVSSFDKLALIFGKRHSVYENYVVFEPAVVGTVEKKKTPKGQTFIFKLV